MPWWFEYWLSEVLFFSSVNKNHAFETLTVAVIQGFKRLTVNCKVQSHNYYAIPHACGWSSTMQDRKNLQPDIIYFYLCSCFIYSATGISSLFKTLFVCL